MKNIKEVIQAGLFVRYLTSSKNTIKHTPQIEQAITEAINIYTNFLQVEAGTEYFRGNLTEELSTILSDLLDAGYPESPDFSDLHIDPTTHDEYDITHELVRLNQTYDFYDSFDDFDDHAMDVIYDGRTKEEVSLIDHFFSYLGRTKKEEYIYYQFGQYKFYGYGHYYFVGEPKNIHFVFHIYD